MILLVVKRFAWMSSQQGSSPVQQPASSHPKVAVGANVGLWVGAIVGEKVGARVGLVVGAAMHLLLRRESDTKERKGKRS